MDERHRQGNPVQKGERLGNIGVPVRTLRVPERVETGQQCRSNSSTTISPRST